MFRERSLTLSRAEINFRGYSIILGVDLTSLIVLVALLSLFNYEFTIIIIIIIRWGTDSTKFHPTQVLLSWTHN